jgi:hypothetical protein
MQQKSLADDVDRMHDCEISALIEASDWSHFPDVVAVQGYRGTEAERRAALRAAMAILDSRAAQEP